MRVEEERVISPRERLNTPVHVFVFGSFWQMASVLGLDVLDMGFMFILNIAYPGGYY